MSPALLRRRALAWVALALVLGLAAAARWRVLDAPLERDEGEYAYIGQLMLQGVPPYAEAYNMKLPGIYAAYAGVMAILGETPRGIHQGALVFNLASCVLLFLLVRRLAGELAGLAATAGFAVLSISVAVQGTFANAEHFILPFALGGTLLTLVALEEGCAWRLFVGGLLLGCALVVKQHGLFFLVGGGALVLAWLARRRPLRPADALGRLGLFTLGGVVPYGLTCLAMWLAGVFPSFWLWTFRYARAYSSRVSLAENSARLGDVSGEIFRAAPVVCSVAVLGLGLAAVALRGRPRGRWIVMPPFVLLSVLSVFPGYLFRPHYFQLALPAVALAFGLGVAALARIVQRYFGPHAALATGAVLAAVAVGQSVAAQRRALFEISPVGLSIETFGPQFQFSQRIAARLAADTTPEDRIGVLGSEPELCFYARRRSASGFLYTYPLMEDQPFADQMIARFEGEIEHADPRYLVWVGLPWSWLPRPEPMRQVAAWFDAYRRGYELVARYDVSGPGVRLLEGPALRASPAPRFSVDLWRRIGR